MNTFITLFAISLNAILAENFILVKFLGIFPFMGVSKKTDTAVGMGIAVVFVIVMATLVCWPIYNFVLIPANMSYMKTIVFILVIASLVQMVGFFIKKKSPALYKSLGIYLPLITTNCAVLGVCSGNVGYDFGYAMANAIGTSLGFLLVIFLYACIRVRLEGSSVPKAFKGVPIALIVAGLMAFVFASLNGMIDLGAWGVM